MNAAREGKEREVGSFEEDAIRKRTLKALKLIQQSGYVPLATRPNLYKKCKDGILFFESARRRGISRAVEPFQYTSLRGQQTAQGLANATLDNVLSIIIDERSDGKWSFDIVLDNGLIFGSPENKPCTSREEVEQRALAGLRMIGHAAEPAPDFDQNKLEIQVNGTVYVVPKIPYDQNFFDAVKEAVQGESTTYHGLLARFAKLVLVDGAEHHPAALAMLANCGWTAVTQETLERFCEAKGVDDLRGYSGPGDHQSHPVLH